MNAKLGRREIVAQVVAGAIIIEAQSERPRALQYRLAPGHRPGGADDDNWVLFCVCLCSSRYFDRNPALTSLPGGIFDKLGSDPRYYFFLAIDSASQFDCFVWMPSRTIVKISEAESSPQDKTLYNNLPRCPGEIGSKLVSKH